MPKYIYIYIYFFFLYQTWKYSINLFQNKEHYLDLGLQFCTLFHIVATENSVEINFTKSLYTQSKFSSKTSWKFFDEKFAQRKLCQSYPVYMIKFGQSFYPKLQFCGKFKDKKNGWIGILIPKTCFDWSIPINVSKFSGK